MGIETVATPGLWIGFTLLILLLLTLDLGVFHRHAHAVSLPEALTWSVVWVGVALLFNAGIVVWFGAERGLEFLTGYVVEKALAIDNIFVFMVIFSAFAVPAALQHTVLFWGILGALVLRAVFVMLGAALLQQFHWVMYLFGGFLVLTGIKLLIQRHAEVHPERNPLFGYFRRLVPSVSDYRGARFFVIEAGRRCATPLFMVLVLVEITDVIFAVDSIPAIFAVTTDPFIVYTSNIFAILGLRALYFALAGMLGTFRYLKVGLSLVLVFVGAKMLLIDVYKIPILMSLGVIVVLLASAVVASLLRPPTQPPLPVHSPQHRPADQPARVKP
jgi:tellurite resistance protein TerC